MLCVGDGANDIGMIRESDIGIGIKGKEGLQAYNNCDVGLPSFRYISKLLFVHGKSNEMRLQTLILYFLILAMITDCELHRQPKKSRFREGASVLTP